VVILSAPSFFDYSPNRCMRPLVRVIGLERVQAQLGLKNLVYNLKRYVFWQKKTRATAQVQCV
jgi:hypothetical protein